MLPIFLENMGRRVWLMTGHEYSYTAKLSYSSKRATYGEGVRWGTRDATGHSITLKQVRLLFEIVGWSRTVGLRYFCFHTSLQSKTLYTSVENLVSVTFKMERDKSYSIKRIYYSRVYMVLFPITFKKTQCNAFQKFPFPTFDQIEDSLFIERLFLARKKVFLWVRWGKWAVKLEAVDGTIIRELFKRKALRCRAGRGQKRRRLRRLKLWCAIRR